MAKYVLRFSTEYGATCLWPENEAAIDKYSMPIQYDEISISQSLKSSLERFDERVMDTIDWDNPGGKSPLSAEEHHSIYVEVQRLLRLITDELGEEFEIIEDLGWLKGSNNKDSDLKQQLTQKYGSIKNMPELINKLYNIPDVYPGFVIAVINYVSKKIERTNVVLMYLEVHKSVLTSDVLEFISRQDDFYEDAQ